MGIVIMWQCSKFDKFVPVGCTRKSRDTQYVFKMHFAKLLLPETTRPRAVILGHLEVIYQRCSNYVPRVKPGPASGATSQHCIV